MATFEDNAVVTAEDLNNIAVDLGDTTFSAFADEKFGVDKLNEITADLVSKGILTTGNKCEPIVKDGKVYIKSGVIVFGSGAKIRIESPVEVGAAAGDYIYAFNDVATGKASIMMSAEIPTSGDYVMLAQLDAAGVIVDLREMSVANLTLAAELQNNILKQTVELALTAPNTHDEIVVTPDLPACKLLILVSGLGVTDYKYYVYQGVELSEEYQIIFNDSYSFDSGLEVKKVNGLLYFRYYNSICYPATITFILA